MCVCVSNVSSKRDHAKKNITPKVSQVLKLPPMSNSSHIFCFEPLPYNSPRTFHKLCSLLPLSRTRRDVRGCWQGVKGNFWCVGRELVKVPECLKKDFRLSRVQNTPRFLRRGAPFINSYVCPLCVCVSVTLFICMGKPYLCF